MSNIYRYHGSAKGWSDRPELLEELRRDPEELGYFNFVQVVPPTTLDALTARLGVGTSMLERSTVKYFKSMVGNEVCYFITWGGLEYVFTLGGK